MTDIRSTASAGADVLLPFSLPARNVRGRVVRLGPALDRAGAAGSAGPWIDAVVYGISVVQLNSIVDEVLRP